MRRRDDQLLNTGGESRVRGAPGQRKIPDRQRRLVSVFRERPEPPAHTAGEKIRFHTDKPLFLCIFYRLFPFHPC